ncbi:hypothetical protein Tco_0160739 [Tanacetum coccineum]
MTLLLRNITVPPSTGILTFCVPWMARHGSLLCWDGDLITMKSIYAEVECSSSLIFTSRDIWPIGQMVSPLNPMSDVVAGIIWLLISGRILTKQSSMIIGPSVLSSSPKDGKEITVSGEKLWVRILQKSQENGQNLTNTNTGMDRVHKSGKVSSKGQQSQPRSTH